MIELLKFEREDGDRMISWSPAARFLLQWAGPQYSWPLDQKQILGSLAQTRGERPVRCMFKAVETSNGNVVGHIELVHVDYDKNAGHVGRVLIGNPSHRGRGLGKELMLRLVTFSFDKLRLRTLTLDVFDFNYSAVNCYRDLGFEQFDFHANARKFEQESWNLVMMALRNHKYG